MPLDEAGTAEFLRGVLSASPTVSAVIDAEGTILWISQNVTELFGFAPEELVHTSMLEHMDLEWNEFAIHSVGYAFENPGQHLPMLFRFIHRDGTGLICEVTANNQFDHPSVAGLVVQVRPWMERVLLDRVLDSLAGGAAIEETLGLLVEVMGAEMLDARGSILFGPVGRGFTSCIAAPDLDAVLSGEPSEATSAEADTPWARTLSTGQPQFLAVDDLPEPLRERARDAGFAACWTWPVGVSGGVGVQACLVAWRVLPGDPEPSCELAAHRVLRLTALALERERNEARLLHAALHDPLTGLANRANFFGRVDEALLADGGGLVGVLYVDLDGFKPVNDHYGHGVGDQVLVTIARRLEHVVRPSDVVARLGGDEFAVLCPVVGSEAEVEGVAERLVDQAKRPIDVDGHVVHVGASIGVALANARSCSSDSLVEAADAALYAVKGGAKGGWHLAPSLDRTG
jgi:diguanylate cyclase (GGDEF)-like protein/PAS domain S-box-containing protein